MTKQIRERKNIDPASKTRNRPLSSWSVFPCFQDVIVGMQKPAVRKAFYLRARPMINLVFGKKAKKEPVINWGLKHGMYAYEAKDAYGYA